MQQQAAASEPCPKMVLVLELGVWIIPLTLVLAPCRRLVRLVAELQRLQRSLVRSGYLSPAAWSDLIRVSSLATVML